MMYRKVRIGAPWTDINPIGAKYDLISNNEWMTIARDAEAQSLKLEVFIGPNLQQPL